MSTAAKPLTHEEATDHAILIVENTIKNLKKLPQTDFVRARVAGLEATLKTVERYRAK